MGRRGAMDGAERVKPRPGTPKQEVEEWKANPSLSGHFYIARTCSMVCEIKH